MKIRCAVFLGMGYLASAAVCAIVTACFHRAYSVGEFPTSVPGCDSFIYASKKLKTACLLESQQLYWKQVKEDIDSQEI